MFYSIEINMSVETPITFKPTNPIIIKFLLKFSGYYDGVLQRFSLNNDKLSLIAAEDDFKPKLLIVSAKYYQEKQLSFPVDSRKELKKLLKLQFNKSEIALIQSQDDNQSAVNTWTFNNEVFRIAPKAWFILPESILLANTCANGEVLTVLDKNEQQSYITTFNNIIHSAKQSALINNVDNFAISSGIAVNQQYTLSYADKAQALAVNITGISIDKLLAFVRKPAPKNLKLITMQLIAPSIAAISLYLILTSIYIVTKSAWLNSELNEQSEQVTELFTLQSSVDTKYLSYQKLTKFWQNKKNIAGLWQVVAPMFAEASIQNITLRERRFFIKGRTSSASQLLELIANNPNVTNAKFEAPVRQDRSLERFYISLELNKTLLLPTPVNEKISEGVPLSE